MGYLDIADRTWPVLHRVMGAHTVAYRMTGGLVGHRIPFLPRMLLLEHVGAKSGRRRTSPLVYFRDGDDIVLVASKGGFERHPAWFHNLRANPDTRVQVGHRRPLVRARVATDAERERLWPKAVETYAGYAGYAKRTDRKIPLVILEPRG
ncbi:MAG: nitroreductase family deazaflavin-dependent oxidoreductase [Thermoleophilaceae bacterium]